jgi:hypothetical protein
MQVKGACYHHGVIYAPGFGGRKKGTDVVMFSALRFCKIQWGLVAHRGYKNVGLCGRTFRDIGIECRVSVDSESRQ